MTQKGYDYDGDRYQIMEPACDELIGQVIEGPLCTWKSYNANAR